MLILEDLNFTIDEKKNGGWLRLRRMDAPGADHSATAVLRAMMAHGGGVAAVARERQEASGDGGGET